jgi:hypothetical protein
VTILHNSVGQHDVALMEKALVDRGANSGFCGKKMRVTKGSERVFDVSGHSGHKLSRVTAQALISAHKGDAIATFYQKVLLGKGKSVL